MAPKKNIKYKFVPLIKPSRTESTDSDVTINLNGKIKNGFMGEKYPYLDYKNDK
jgi:hypothetical protein